MKIAMIAPPWVSTPPQGYGGIEIVLEALVTALAALGAEVHLYTVGRASTSVPRGVHVHVLDPREQYGAISGELYDSISIPTAHVVRALGEIAGQGFDIVHDHNAFVGPTACANLDPRRFPPVLHTLHSPFTPQSAIALGVPDNRDAYRAFARADRLWFNGISAAQVRDAPVELRARLLGVVHNGVTIEPMAAGASRGPQRHGFLTLARVCADKGQGLAARTCAELGERLTIAGAVDGDGDPETVLRAAAAALAGGAAHPDLDYFARQVLPYLRPGSIDYVGDLAGARKHDLLATARALLFPIDWEEPFGMAVIEALAAGTPVVAMRRGAMPELIEHGVNGFLADTTEEFAQHLGAVDSIHPEQCRRSVTRRFSAGAMARGYMQLYERAIAQDVSRPVYRRRIAPVNRSGLDDLDRAIHHGDLPRRIEHLDAAQA